MSSDIGIKLGVEGDREFRKILADINQSFKVLGSEMALVTSQFDKSDKSMKKLTPEVLREFVVEIVVHHRQRVDGVDEQRIEIFYNCVGKIEIPDAKKIPQTDILIPTRKGAALSYSQSQKTDVSLRPAI